MDTVQRAQQQYADPGCDAPGTPGCPETDARSLFGSSRLSQQRAIIGARVLEERGAFTAEQLHAAATRHDPSVGVATVYRAITAMLEAGSIARIGQRGSSVLFARCDGGDHHHAICEECGAVARVACPLQPDTLGWTTSGGVILRHELTLYGRCPECNARRGGS